MKTHYVHMGQLVRPHGILGEIVVNWYAISPFSSQMPLFIQKTSEEPKSISIASYRLHNERLLIKLADINDRNQAELLRNYKLLTLRENLPAIAKNEAYICDLLGAKILLPTGQEIGHFSHVLRGLTHIWSIKTGDDQEILFPAEPEFIVEFDLENKSITIDPPIGLIELYQSNASQEA